MGIPLFVVTMVSQNIPGIAVLRTAGYPRTDFTDHQLDRPHHPAYRAFRWLCVNLAAITAAICTGPEAHADRRQTLMSPA